MISCSTSFDGHPSSAGVGARDGYSGGTAASNLTCRGGTGGGASGWSEGSVGEGLLASGTGGSSCWGDSVCEELLDLLEVLSSGRLSLLE